MNRDEIEAQLGQRIDMRAVVIVEFWAMMAGALPFGWQRRGWDIYGPRPLRSVYAPPWGDRWLPVREAWGAEYAARPRLDP